MIYTTTSVFTKNIEAFYKQDKRICINQGGTSSSKTFSILQALILIATSDYSGVISIVSESLPHLKRGCIRDFKTILLSSGAWDDDKWNKSDFIYQFTDKSIIEFFSADQPDKCRGSRRNILYINECNNILKSTYDELQVRTKDFTFLDYNPVADFWAMELIGQPEVEFIKSTYMDAKCVLPQSIVDNIESRRERDPNWWTVYGLGEVGKSEGLIHPFFHLVKEFPTYGDDNIFGLDFGYNDPCSFVKTKIMNDCIVSDLLIYESGLTNQDLSNRFIKLGIRKHNDLIIADCAEPKSIEELYRMGWNIKPCIKGPDSVVAGIQKINQYKQFWTDRSIEAIKEQRNYMWDTDKEGKLTDRPRNNGYDHALDARRYSVTHATMSQPQGQAYRIAI